MLVAAISIVALAGCLPNPTEASSPTVHVPTSIDGTGKADVSAAMAEFIASVPDGSTIVFPAGARYRMESTLEVNDRHHLTFDGNGATVFATTPGEPDRANFRFMSGSNIVVQDIRVEGAHPNAGDGGDFVVEKEGQHGFDIRGTEHIALIGVSVTDPYGDFVHIGRDLVSRVWSNQVRITDSNFAHSGRQGITLFAARNVVIERNTITDVRRATFDFEPGPASSGWGVENVIIRDNDIGPGQLKFVAAGGGGPVDNITIEGNRLQGQNIQFLVIGNTSGATRRNWKVLDNTSDLHYNNAKYQAVMRFYHVDGLVVHGNTQALKGDGMYGVRAEQSCNLALDGNSYPGGVGQALIMDSCSSSGPASTK